MDTTRKVRHFCFFIVAVLFTFLLYLLIEKKLVAQRISISTAYTSLLFFAIALSIGPVNLLLSRINPLSINLRRDLGIWSAIMAIIHTVAGLQVHLGGNFLNYFIYPPTKPHIVPVRYDPFGLTNHLGLVCTLIMILLLFLSNNRSIKILGPGRWKKWQRSSYILAVAMPLHGLIYQILEKRIGIYTLLMFTIILTAAVFQISGILQYRKKHKF